MKLIQFGAAAAALVLVSLTAPSPIAWAADGAPSKMSELPSGLKYSDTTVGTGAEATKGKKVSVHYTGWLYNNATKGAKFDSSLDRGQPFEFALVARQVISVTWPSRSPNCTHCPTRNGFSI